MYSAVDWSNPVSNHPLTQGLVSWWLAGEASPFWGTPILRDLVLRRGSAGQGGNHGVLTNGPVWQGAIAGMGGWGAIRVGDSDAQYADCGTAGPWMSTQTAISVVVKCRTDTASDSPAFNGFRYIVSAENSNTGIMQFVLRLRPVDGLIEWQVYDGGYYTATATVTVAVGKTYHLVGTYTAGSGKLYVDGIEGGSHASGGTLAASPVSLKIGGSGEQTNRQWLGAIDDVAYYTRALTAGEAYQWYVQSRAGHPDMLRRRGPQRRYVPVQAATAPVLWKLKPGAVGYSVWQVQA